MKLHVPAWWASQTPAGFVSRQSPPLTHPFRLRAHERTHRRVLRRRRVEGTIFLHFGRTAARFGGEGVEPGSGVWRFPQPLSFVPPLSSRSEVEVNWRQPRDRRCTGPSGSVPPVRPLRPVTFLGGGPPVGSTPIRIPGSAVPVLVSPHRETEGKSGGPPESNVARTRNLTRIRLILYMLYRMSLYQRRPPGPDARHSKPDQDPLRGASDGVTAGPAPRP